MDTVFAWRSAVISLLLFLGAASAVSQSSLELFDPQMKPLIAHTIWTARDGAPANISALAQTEDGYLWLGSSMGLYRFDGLQFTSYPVTSLDEKLPYSDIQALCSDLEGGLWIGYRLGGISHLARDGKLTNYNPRNGHGPNSALKLIVRSDHSVWAIGDDKLLLLNGDHWENFGATHGLPGDDQILSLFFDRAGNLWTSVRRKLLVLHPGEKTFVLYPTESFMVVDFAEMPDGKLWISDGWRSVRPLDPSPSRLPIPVKGYTRIKLDSSGALWMAQDYRGISHLQLNSGDASGVEEHEISSQQINAILRDRDGAIWAGTSHGLDRFRSTQAQALSNVRLEYYPALASDPDHGVWLSTLAHPVLHAVSGVLKPVGGIVGASPILVDVQKRLWLTDPTKDVVMRYENDRDEPSRIPIPIEVHHAPAQALGLDRDGALLISFSGAGLWRYRDTWTPIDDVALPPFEPLSIFRGPDGRVWFGYADSNVIVSDAQGFHSLPSSNNADIGSVLTFAMVHGRLWAAGTNGLAYLDEGIFHGVHLRGGSPLRGISGAIEDRSGNLWVNTNSGILRIPGDQVAKALKGQQQPLDYDLFDVRQGVSGGATQLKPTPSAAADKDGPLWFATSGNVFMLNPESLTLHHSTPDILLESVLANGVPVMDREHGLMRFTRRANELTNLEIDYIAMDLSSPEKITYEYMLEPEDKTWQQAGSRRQAFYSHLKPGEYRFRVKAQSGSAQQSELITPLTLKITPAFYQTLWFEAICLLATVALLYFLYQLRVRFLVNRVKERMQERASERLRIARDLHDTLLQSIHGLMLRFHFATEALAEDEPARASLQLALSRADSVILEGRQLVKDLREEVPDGTNLATQIGQIADGLEIHQTLSFRLIEEGEPKTLNSSVQTELCRIAQEVLTNTIRHSSAANADIFLIYKNSEFLMKCSDDGHGFSPAILKNGGLKGHWGLPGMSERAATIDGKVRVHSSPGNGTQIEVCVPATKAYQSAHSRISWLKHLVS